MSEPKQMPDSGTNCWCVKCGAYFRAWPNLLFCLLHREDWYEY